MAVQVCGLFMSCDIHIWSNYMCTGNLIDSNNIACIIILIVWINEWSDFVFVIIKNIFICEINRHLIVFRNRVDFFLLVNTCTVLKRILHSFFFIKWVCCQWTWPGCIVALHQWELPVADLRRGLWGLHPN